MSKNIVIHFLFSTHILILCQFGYSRTTFPGIPFSACSHLQLKKNETNLNEIWRAEVKQHTLCSEGRCD